MRDRDPEMLEGRNAGADARNHLIGYARFFQRQRLFSAPAKDRRIAPLEPHDLQSPAREVDQERLDLLLLLFVRILPLSHTDQFTPLGCFPEQCAVQKIVIYHDLRPSQDLQAFHGDQPGLASRAGDPHFSRHICLLSKRPASAHILCRPGPRLFGPVRAAGTCKGMKKTRFARLPKMRASLCEHFFHSSYIT